jgi:Pyridine nucleotide-disulphide oxidoreductase, dimerisation domain
MFMMALPISMTGRGRHLGGMGRWREMPIGYRNHTALLLIPLLVSGSEVDTTASLWGWCVERQWCKSTAATTEQQSPGLLARSQRSWVGCAMPSIARGIVDQDTKEILGASMLGVPGDKAIHTILALIYARAPYTVLQSAMFIYPTVSELLPIMIGRLKPL